MYACMYMYVVKLLSKLNVLEDFVTLNFLKYFIFQKMYILSSELEREVPLFKHLYASSWSGPKPIHS